MENADKSKVTDQLFEELFIGAWVEVVLLDYSATNPPPGVAFPNEGTLVAHNAAGVVLRRGKNQEQISFFPYATIRCIRIKKAAKAAA